MDAERWIPQFHGMPELRRMPTTPGNSSGGSIWWPVQHYYDLGSFSSPVPESNGPLCMF